ncbi:hypothetical protein [Sulfurimonas sp.]
MAIEYEGNVATFVSKINEDEIIPFRDFLQEKAGEDVHLNFVDCQEVHFALIQLAMAYIKNYNATYEFGESKKLFQTLLEGFDSSKISCDN